MKQPMTAEEYIQRNKTFAENRFHDQEVLTVYDAREAIRLSKIEALEKALAKFNNLSVLSSISDAEIILISQINQLKNKNKMETNKTQAETEIIFNVESEKEPIIKLCQNGDIFVKGKLIKNDMEVVEGMREFLKKANDLKNGK